MDSTSVSIGLKAGKNAGEINELYEAAWAYLVATIKKNTKHKSSKTVLDDYLSDSDTDGRGASTAKQLTFVFRSPSSLCDVQMAVTEHWFELAIALGTKELAALCLHHGYALKPRRAAQARQPFIPHGNQLLAVTKKGQVVSDDAGEQSLEEAELPKAVTALAKKVAKSGVCECAFCATLRARKAVAPKWTPEKPKAPPKPGTLPKLEHFTSLAKAVKSPDRAGTCEMKDQGPTAIVIPDDVGKLQRLTQLILHGYVTEIPDGLYTLGCLKTLALRGREVTEDLAKLTKLESLSLLGGADYPDAIGSLQELGYLSLCFGKTKRLPESIAKLPKLATLWLEKLEELRNPLPPIGELSSLRVLGIRGIRKPKGLLDRVDFSKLLELERLENTAAPFAAYPKTLRALPKLVTLKLEDVPGDWPDDLDMPALETLWARSCGLTRWPKGLNRLKHLKDANLDSSELTDIDALRELPALEYLSLSGNPLTHLPAKKPKLPKLERFDCNCETLHHLPSWLAELPSLKYLTVSSSVPQTECEALKKKNRALEISVY